MPKAKHIDIEKLNGRPYTFDADEIIYQQGDLAEEVFYIQRGQIKVTVESEAGRVASVGILDDHMFFGEQALAGASLRLSTTVAMVPTKVIAIPKDDMRQAIKNDPQFAETFMSYLLKRNTRIEADLIDQLFNSAERRLARLLLLLAQYGREGGHSHPIPRAINQETLAEMIGTTRPRISSFMNKFRRLGFISYDGSIEVHSSLLSAVLHEPARDAEK